MPKTAAGRRRVILPGSIIAEVQEHLDNYTAPALHRPAADVLLFTSPRGELHVVKVPPQLDLAACRDF